MTNEYDQLLELIHINLSQMDGFPGGQDVCQVLCLCSETDAELRGGVTTYGSCLLALAFFVPRARFEEFRKVGPANLVKGIAELSNVTPVDPLERLAKAIIEHEINDPQQETDALYTISYAATSGYKPEREVYSFAVGDSVPAESSWPDGEMDDRRWVVKQGFIPAQGKMPDALSFEITATQVA